MRAVIRPNHKNHPGTRLLAGASAAALSLLIASCAASNTIDYLYVTSNLVNPGQINVYSVDSESGALKQIADSPYPSGGRNPVDEVASPNGKNLYVVNHDDNTIVEFAIGTDGKLYPLQTVNTPGTEPVALAVSPTGNALYVLDYYAPAAPGQPSYTDLNPGPGALVVYPLTLNSSGLGTIGSPLAVGAANYFPVQCFPTNLSVTPNGNFVYITNTNAVVVTTSPPVTGTVPTLPAVCPASGTVSAFAVTASSVTPVAGSPFTTGSGSQPTGIIADPGNGSIYVTDSRLNQLYTFSIQSGSGALSLTTTAATGNMPMGGTVISTASSGKFLYITNYKDGSIGIYSLASGSPSFVATSNSGSSGPLCVLAEPDTFRFLYTSNYIGGTIGGAELNPSTGALINNQNSPYPTSGQPTCVAAITHSGGNKNGLP